MKLIDGDKLFDLLHSITTDSGDYKITRITRALIDMPAVDAVPVIHAHWIHTFSSIDSMDECLRCSNCGFDDLEMHVSKYCPECGAIMDGKE